MNQEFDHSTEILHTSEEHNSSPPEQYPVLPKSHSVHNRLSEFRFFLGRWKSGGDPSQKKIARVFLWFIAIMLLLTLLSRGVAAATLPVIRTTGASKAEIVDQTSADGFVSSKKNIDIALPDGLTPTQILVSQGGKIEPGTDLAAFDPEEVADKLAREKAELDRLKQEQSVLQRPETVDGSSLTEAQIALDNARQNVGTQTQQLQSAINRATDDLNAANQAVTNAQADLDALPTDATPEQRAQLVAALESARQQAKMSQNAVDDARQAYDTGTASAAQQVADAERRLSSAQVANDKSQQQNNDLNAANAIKAKALELDINAQTKKITALETIQNNDNHLKSEISGSVTTVNPAPMQGQPLLQISDSTGGFKAESLLTKEQAKIISLGQEVEISGGGSSKTKKPALGKIEAFSEPDAEGNVKATISLPEQDWKEGQTIQVKVILSREKFDLCIPLAALRENNSGYYVLVVENSSGVLGLETVVKSIPVELLAKDNTNAAIDGPISSSDKIVTDSTKPIKDASRVRVENK